MFLRYADNKQTIDHTSRQEYLIDEAEVICKDERRSVEVVDGSTVIHTAIVHPNLARYYSTKDLVGELNTKDSIERCPDCRIDWDIKGYQLCPRHLEMERRELERYDAELENEFIRGI